VRKDKELKSALKKPAKDVPSKKTLPEVCKTTKREASACECVHCLKGLLNQVKIDVEKKQDQKKHVSFDNRYHPLSFPQARMKDSPSNDFDLDTCHGQSCSELKTDIL
jgi:hypothetical protein